MRRIHKRSSNIVLPRRTPGGTRRGSRDTKTAATSAWSWDFASMLSPRLNSANSDSEKSGDESDESQAETPLRLRARTHASRFFSEAPPDTSAEDAALRMAEFNAEKNTPAVHVPRREKIELLNSLKEPFSRLPPAELLSVKGDGGGGGGGGDAPAATGDVGDCEWESRGSGGAGVVDDTTGVDTTRPVTPRVGAGEGGWSRDAGLGRGGVGLTNSYSSSLSEGGWATLEERLTSYYSKYAPQHIGKAKEASRHFANNVNALSNALKSKYGVSLDEGSTDPPAAVAEVTDANATSTSIAATSATSTIHTGSTRGSTSTSSTPRADSSTSPRLAASPKNTPSSTLAAGVATNLLGGGGNNAKGGGGGGDDVREGRTRHTAILEKQSDSTPSQRSLMDLAEPDGSNPNKSVPGRSLLKIKRGTQRVTGVKVRWDEEALYDAARWRERDTKRNSPPAAEPIPASTPVSSLKLDLISIARISDAFKELEKNLSATVSPCRPLDTPFLPLRRREKEDETSKTEEDAMAEVVTRGVVPESEPPRHRILAKEIGSSRVVRRNSKSTNEEQEEEQEMVSAKQAVSPRFALPFWNEWNNT